MYLSRVKIDSHNRRKLRDLTHLGAYHAWVEDSFPDEREDIKENRTRKLWRVDQINGESYLLVLSKNKPDLEKLEKYGVKSSAETKLYDKLLESIEVGMRARFKICLNTVKSIRDDKNELCKRGRLVPVGLDELHKFFLDRTEKNGFSVKDNEFDITSRGEKLFVKKEEDNGKNTKMNLVSATYEGILTVRDVDKFKYTLVNGVGRKKAYGFGLLTIIPYHE